MGLAVKSPPCCCRTLRTASLILLYFNLVVNGYALLSRLLRQANNNSSTSYMQALEIDSILVIDALIEVSSCVIFLIAIFTIYKEKPSVHMLTAAVCILLVTVVYSLYVMIAMNVNDNFEKLWKILVDESVANSKLDGEKREEFKSMMMSLAKPMLVFLNVIVLGGSVFELYSALIFHSYKEELKQKPVYGAPHQQYNPQDREANASAPYPPNAQFVNAQYPTKPSQYDLPPKYPNQPPPQNYPRAPPY